MTSPEAGNETGFVVIVPTRNRQALLHELLENLNSWTLIPKAVFVVDSSDSPLEISKQAYGFPVNIIFSSISSAAHQRNLGIEAVLREFREVSYIFFMDDDVRTMQDYPARCITTFQLNVSKGIVGVSGVTKGDEFEYNLRKFLSPALFQICRPSTITKSVINISPSKREFCSDADWLIGCSVWSMKVINQGIRFEGDFTGQSLFEDVIFSWRARSLGRLVCNPEIILEHLQSPLERPDLYQHYKAWVVNRYRIFNFNFPHSSLWFFSWNFLLCFVCSIQAIFGSSSARRKLAGLTAGTKVIVRAMLK